MDNTQRSYLVETAKWQKVIGILMAIGTGILALAAVFFPVLGIFAPEAIASADQPAAYFITMGIIYIPLTVLYFFMTRYMLRSAKYLKAWGTSEAENESDLTEGLKNTKSYFKLSGIVALASIALVVLMLVVIAIVAVVSIA
jgi:hypothetical protein